MSNISGIAPQQLLTPNDQMHNASNNNAQQATGNLGGRNVTQTNNPQSMIASAAEELTTSLESKSSDEFAIKDREQHKRGGSDTLLKAVQEYADAMNDDNRSAKRAMLSQVLRATQTKEEVIERTSEQFSSKSDAYASLAEIADEYSKEVPQPTGLKAVLEAMESMETEFGTEIRAGFKGAINASGFSDIGTAVELRDLYTTTVTITSTPDAVLARLLEEYDDDDDLDRAIEFLLLTLGGDLDSGEPSMDKAQLQSIMGDIEKTQQLHSSHKLCSTALGRWKERHGGGGEKSTLTPLGMVRDLVNLKNENYVSSSNIGEITQKADPQDIEREVLFLQEMLMAVRKFPIFVFDSVENRVKVLDAVQEAVDDAVRREDEILYQKEHPDVPLPSKEENIQ